MSAVKVTDASFESDVVQSSAPVVVDFWAEWCTPCKLIGPSLDEIAVEMRGKIKIAKLNIEENPNVVSRLGVRSIPTLMLFHNGKLQAQKVGAAPKSDIVKWISANIPVASTH